MNDATIHDTVTAMLKAWPGFPRLHVAMNEFPEVSVYLAGGAVRRVLLAEERPVKDFDFFLDGPYREEFTERLAQDGVMGHTGFGSPRWFPAPHGSPSADLMHVRRLSSGLPKCRDIVGALKQGDCTVNAVAVNLRTGAVVDPLHGRRDAARRIMRAVRFDFSTQPIRPGTRVTYLDTVWVRFVHYASILGLRIEPRTSAWLRTYCPSEIKIREFAEMAFNHGLRFGVDRFSEYRLARLGKSCSAAACAVTACVCARFSRMSRKKGNSCREILRRSRTFGRAAPARYRGRGFPVARWMTKGAE